MNLTKKSCSIIILMVICFVSFFTTNVSHATDSFDENIKIVNRLSPDSLDNVTITENTKEFYVEQKTQVVTINKADFSEITINASNSSLDSNHLFKIDLPIHQNADTIVEDNCIVSDEKYYSTVTEIGEGELQINFVIDDKNAPERFVLDYEIPKGAQIRFASY